MFYRTCALLLLVAFYGVYFAKMLVQKRRGITTYQVGKEKEHNTGFYVEVLMAAANGIVLAAELLSIFLGKSGLPIMIRIIGIYFAFVGDIVFLLAVISMKDSWRAGVARGDFRPLVTDGIYKYSRNPAFLAYDLVYIGILLMYFNPLLLVATVFAVVMLHLQILQEEAYLEVEFTGEYDEYKKNTNRYAGYGKLTFKKFLLYVYVLLFIWSVLYFATCFVFGRGFRLSWIWLWLLIAGFSGFRLWMLKGDINGRPRFDIPPVITWIYRGVFAAVLALFIFTEINVVRAMTASPAENLDYVVVLGAGMIGKEPTNTLRARIDRAGKYLQENPGTIAIASGGQGRDEEISEAECIRNGLVERYGIDENRIILEEESRDTEENLENSYEIIGDSEASVGIITNGFHEYRAMTIAKHAGYRNVKSVPAVTLFPLGVHFVVREFFGMAEQYVK